MKLFKKRLPEKQLVMWFLEMCKDDTEKAINAIILLINNSPLSKDYEIDTQKNRDIIANWFFAVNMLPVKNLFKGQLEKNIYLRSIKGFSYIRNLDDTCLLIDVDNYINDFHLNYKKRKLVFKGVLSQWLVDRLFGNTFNDPVLTLSLDTFATSSSFKWKKANEEYNIIEDKNPVMM